MSWNLCTSGAAIVKAGLNVNSDIVNSGVVIDRWSDESEGFINTETRRDWIKDSASANFAGVVEDVVSSHIAIKMINYDMSGYTSRQEAGTMLDVNADIVRKGIAFIKEKEYQEKM